MGLTLSTLACEAAKSKTPAHAAPGGCRPAGAAAFIAALLLASPLSAGILDWLIPKRDVQVIAVTDTTPVGALRRAATAENPLYYSAVNIGYKDFGGIIAGDKIPPKDEMVKTIARVLAKQGYLPASDKNPPTLLLLWTWGTMNTDRLVLATGDEGPQVNRRQLLRFMGAYKLGLISKEPRGFQDDMMMTGVMFRDADSEMIYDLASEDLYVAAISAYDFGAAIRKEKVLLWTTKISCPSRGLAMNETLPTMLAIAGPHIGRETPKPVSINASDKFKPDVKIGDPTVVEYLEKKDLPIVDAPASAGKKQPAPPAKKQKK